jgi:hypothetical protein
MFQYAAGNALAGRHGVRLALDINGFRSYPLRSLTQERTFRNALTVPISFSLEKYQAAPSSFVAKRTSPNHLVEAARS